MRRTALGCLAWVLLVVALPAPCLLVVHAAFCSVARSERLAPGGAYAALVSRRYCDGGALGGSTSWTVTLRARSGVWLLLPAAAPGVLLLRVADPSGPAAADWEDGRTLVVSYAIGTAQRRMDGPLEPFPPSRKGPDEWRGVAISYRATER